MEDRAVVSCDCQDVIHALAHRDCCECRCHDETSQEEVASLRCPHCHGTDWLPTLRASDDPDWSWSCAWCGLPMPEDLASYLRRLLDPYQK